MSVGEAMQAITRRAALHSLAPATAAAQALLMSIPARDGEACDQTIACCDFELWPPLHRAAAMLTYEP